MKNFLKILFIFIFLVILVYSTTAQTWFKNYGGTNTDIARSIQQTSDGGYIVTGWTYSYTHGSADFAIYKLYSNGNKTWFQHYGGTQVDRAFSIQQTADGGSIVAGRTESYTHGNDDFSIYKLNSSGNKVWFKHYGGISYDRAFSIKQTSDGSYIVAGVSHSYTHGFADFAIYKLNSSGDKVWFKHYGGINDDSAQSIQQTSDGGYVVAGYTASYTHGGADFAIYKLNSSGNKVWFKNYGGTGNDVAYSIQQSSDGGYVIAGYTGSYTHGNKDFAIYKLNSSGNKVWFRHYGGTQDDIPWSIQQSSDGGYVIAGYTGSYTHGNKDFAIYKLDSNGDKVWFKHYGGINDDSAQSIQQSSDGGYIVAGYSGSYTHGASDFAIYKLDSNGYR